MDNLMLEVEGLPEAKFSKGDIILEEGKTDNKVFILKEGAVTVTAAGNEICKANTPGTILGEISALLNGDHAATVKAERDSTLYVINDLFDLFDKNPQACKNVAQLLALRLMNMNHLFAEIKAEMQSLKENFRKNIKKNNHVEQANSKLYTLIEKLDQFWSRDIFNPFSKKH